MKKIIIITFAFVLAPCGWAREWQPVVTEPNTVSSPLKVLFIGNSHTYVNDLDQVLKRLSASPNSPIRIQTARLVEGGAKLQTHWENPKTVAGIKAIPWDIVILQEHSTRPLNQPQAFIEYALKFNTVIRENKSQPVLFMMWAWRDKPEMTESNVKIFTGLGRQIDAYVAPAGLAFQTSLKNHPEINLYDEDGYHPSPQGTYLTACVFYATLTGRSPVGLSNAGMREIPARHTHLLQETAWLAVQDYAQTCINEQEK